MKTPPEKLLGRKWNNYLSIISIAAFIIVATINNHPTTKVKRLPPSHQGKLNVPPTIENPNVNETKTPVITIKRREFIYSLSIRLYLI